MVRIAGLLSKKNVEDPEQLIHSMLSAFVLNDRWKTTCVKLGNVWMGTCHGKSSQVLVSKRVLVIVDGFIYNQADLGFSDAQSAAHVVGVLFEKHGFIKTLSLLNGDFSIALYDLKNNELWLGRDRFGVKPLYYSDQANYFAFASQPRGLIALPDVSGRPNPIFVGLFAASHYRYFDNDPEQSPYVDIRQLPAAHALCISNGKISISPYWSLSELPDFIESKDTLAERYRELLFDAVRLRLKKVGKPAFMLSGGMDSSSVLACAKNILGAKQDAYSVVYQDKTYDESTEISSMLEAHVQNWHRIAVGSPDIFELVERMIHRHDEPVATATWLSHFLLCEEVGRSGVDGLFGGLGGDELNAGEYEYFFFFFADLKKQGKKTILEKETEKWVTYHNHPVFRKDKRIRDKALARLVSWNSPGRCIADRVRIERYGSSINSDYFDLKKFIPTMRHPFSSYLKNRAYQDLFFETIPCSLRGEDRNHTAFGLDHFLPFLDHRLVEFMFRVPGQMKIRFGVTKYLLREAMRGVLPEETRARVKKMGWNAPAHLWFTSKGRDRLLDLVHSKSFRGRGIYRMDEVLRIIEQHEHIVISGRNEENHMMFLWQLVNLATWLTILDRERETLKRPKKMAGRKVNVEARSVENMQPYTVSST